jgi:hypothetical protein
LLEGHWFDGYLLEDNTARSYCQDEEHWIPLVGRPISLLPPIALRNGRKPIMASMAPPRESDESRRCRRLRYVRGHRLAVGISVGSSALVCVAILRMWSVDELPDIGDPFDVG